MLKYFYISKNGYINKSELYPKLKKYSKDIGGAEALVEEMRSSQNFTPQFGKKRTKQHQGILPGNRLRHNRHGRR